MTAMPVTIQERIPLPPGRPGRPAPSGTGMTAGDFMRVLKQRLIMILSIWILASGATVGLTWYLDRYYSSYRANAYVRVDSPYPRQPNSVVEQGAPVDLMNRYVADQAMMMRDETVLRDALADPSLMATSWYQNEDKSQIMQDLKDDLSVSPSTGTSYVSISFPARTPDDSATIVNTIVNKYIDRVRAMAKEKVNSDLAEYKEREELLKKNLTTLLNQKKDFMDNQLGAPGLMEGVNVTGETLRAVASGVVQIEQEKLQYKSLYENLSGTDASQIVVSPEMMMMIQQDPRVSTLEQSRAQLELAKLQLARQYGANHRTVRAIEDQLEVVEQQLQETKAKKEKEVRDYQVNSAYTRYLNAMQTQVQLQERQMEAESKQRDLDRAKVEFQNLEDQQFLLTNELTQIGQTNSQLSLMVSGSAIVRVTPFTAVKPEKKSFPQWKLMLPGGSLLGLLLAVGFAFLLEVMDTSMRTPNDVVRHAHVPILGTVPDLDDEEIPIDQIELAAHTAPRSMTAESFRSIRTNLLLSSPAERQRTVLITSARPEEGKTAIACNLAISIGQSGRRVLLIDANLHRPVLHQIFNRPQKDGLSNALIGQAHLDDLIRTTDLPNLDIITSGPIPPNPTELLSGQYLRDLITQASGRYDQIIFDGPPVLLLSDSLVLAGALDGVILVCRAKATSRGAVQRARELIERVNGRIFGAILNAARVRRGGYFREQIRNYYDYQPEEALAGQGSKSLPDDKDTRAQNKDEDA